MPVITDKKGKVLAEGQNSYTKTHTFSISVLRSVVRKKSVFTRLKSRNLSFIPPAQRKHIRFLLHVHQMKTVLYWLLLKYVKKLSQTSIQIIEYTTRTGSKVERKRFKKKRLKTAN